MTVAKDGRALASVQAGVGRPMRAQLESADEQMRVRQRALVQALSRQADGL